MFDLDPIYYANRHQCNNSYNNRTFNFFIFLNFVIHSITKISDQIYHL